MAAEPAVLPAVAHTMVKHQVYEAYLSKWMPIMISGWGGNITYAEGYSGPGVYDNGRPGSPVIALRTLLDRPGLRTRARQLRFLFVEERSDRATLLRQELEKAAHPVALPDLGQYGIDLAIKTGTCDPELVGLLDRHGAWGRPMLVVLDTFGGGVKLDLVRRIVENPSSEVIITFEPHHFTRFATAGTVTDGDMVFGDPDWRRVAELPPEKKNRWVIEKYRSVLTGIGFHYVLTFELVRTGGHSLFLVFATTHVRGLQKMKEAMWEVDPITGVQYRDPADPDQQLLDIDIAPVTAPLRRELLAHLQEQPSFEASVSDLRRYALYRTVYKESQVKPELDTLAERSQVVGDGPGGIVRLGGRVRLTPQNLNGGER